MNYIQAIILSLVEGITEFLPISSTGHLILASKLLNIPQTEFVKSFEITIQLGAILAVVVLYFQTLLNNREIWKKVLVAFIPSGIIGFLLYRTVKTYLLGNANVVIASLFLGGIAMLILEEFVDRKQKQRKSIENLSVIQSTAIGITQSIAMIPGVSRAMATIFGGLGVGLTRKSAVEFSFLLAVPTMLAATTLDLIKTNFLFTGKDYLLLSIGFVGAFISALITVKGLITFVQKHSFKLFAVYRIILALIFWWTARR
ncbi:MAG: undecaprenyl-diphosphatase UppP [Candidatus Chisholmbacteria bacterium RIFCSPLOWO2_01_FULL_50_28]|uniref:Undecaprenyl-diphosphatase n=1 Tax=Candidatus Chisholmbacteria bacterium RIFCSPHIGHO2_01_FULL_52_32 TaxID=1797591 RepID=A0A1G1VRC6_9BACT|nr:MAG: undecaprenyl-diphosphatase UppP [Candidatus Chisholmbacteria bacterium RIFCSPHIGHO2_01_FULL_52_32]OGY19600.1 MAG: undecaprenyl-diphosphatase UppP [Candidatus Chisholmbacteria bacterium RIFCSPLOWO2_01_FULL_50_28]